MKTFLKKFILVTSLLSLGHLLVDVKAQCTYDYSTVIITQQADITSYFPLSNQSKKLSGNIEFTNPNPNPSNNPITLSLGNPNITVTTSIEFGLTSKIIVGRGVILQIAFCQLKAISCENYWQGIELQDDAQLILTRTSISDALIGVKSNYVNNLISTSFTRFSKNRKHLVIANTERFNITDETIFQADEYLKNTTEYPEIGIELYTDNQITPIPSIHSINNCFVYGNYQTAGIKISRATASINNSHFNNIQGVSSIYSDMNGVETPLYVENCYFRDVAIALNCQNKTALTFNSNNLRYCYDQAIIITNNAGSSANIHNNYIQECADVILLNSNQNASELNIHNNTFLACTETVITANYNHTSTINVSRNNFFGCTKSHIVVAENNNAAVNIQENTFNGLWEVEDDHALKIIDNQNIALLITENNISFYSKSGIYLNNNINGIIDITSNTINQCSYAGIDILRCANTTININDNIDLSNNLMGAIYMYDNQNAIINIKRNEKIDNNGFEVNNGHAIDRGAIFAWKNHSSTINITENNRFFNNKGAIYLFSNKSGAELNAIGNTIIDSKENHAIRVTDCKDSKATIENNTFNENVLSAIFLYNNAGANSRAFVKYNTFTASPVPSWQQTPYKPYTSISINEDAPANMQTYKQLVVHGNTLGNAEHPQDYGIKTYNLVGKRLKDADYPATDVMLQNNGIDKSFINQNTLRIYSTSVGTSIHAPSDYNTGIQLNNSFNMNIGKNDVAMLNDNNRKSWRNRGIHSNNSGNSLYFSNTLKAGRGISAMESALFNDYKCNTLDKCHTGISWGDHTLRQLGGIHGTLGSNARDNYFYNNYEWKHELYAWHFSGGDINNLIQLNQTAWQNSPVILFEGNWGYNVPLPPNNYTLNAGYAPDLCLGVEPWEPGGGDEMYTPLDSNNSVSDYFTDWQQSYHYEKQLKFANGGVYIPFMNQLIELEGFISSGEYDKADSILSFMQSSNTYENNLLTVYSIAISRNLPEYRKLNANEFEQLTNIAQVHPRVGGNAVFTARAMLEHETGQVFIDIEAINRPSGLAVQLDYNNCEGSILPNNFSIKLKDNYNNVYDTIPVCINQTGEAYIKAKYVAALDTSKTYTFELLPASEHIEPALKSISEWVNNLQTIVLCTGSGTPPEGYGKNGNVASNNINQITPANTTDGNSTTTRQSLTNEKQLTIYPNPTNNKLHVSLPTGIYNIEVYDFKGTLVANQKNGKLKAEIETINLPEGLYLINAVNKTNGIIHTQRFIVRH